MSEEGSDEEASEYDDEENEAMRSLLMYQKLRKDIEETNKRRSMWYLVAESLGTVLKVLAPVTIISWLYGHDSFIFRILLQCDRTIRSVISPKHEQRDGVLKWLQEMFPNDDRIKSIDSVWADGSVVCDIVESVIPGSCPGHPQGQKVDMSHAQRLAEQYLGVAPVFTPDELSQRFLTTYKECKLTHYLTSLRDALTQLSPPVSRCGSPILNMQAFTLDYVARGMGLMGGMENRKAIFYIYPTAQQGLEPGDISVQIKGPDSCYGSALIPAVYGRTHIVRSVLMNMGRQNLPVPTFISNNCMKSRFLPKVMNEIDVNVVVKSDSIKVAYMPVKKGYHELSLISKGCHLIGSPFRVNVDKRSWSSRQYYMYDDDASIQEAQNTDRKVVFRIVDFVTEKMILNDDGNLEKLSEHEANELLHRVESIESMKRLQAIQNSPNEPDETEDVPKGPPVENVNLKKNYFRRIGEKVSLLLRFCKEMRSDYFAEKQEIASQAPSCSTTPDLINCMMTIDEGQPSASDMRQRFKNKHNSFNRTSEINSPHSIDAWDFEIDDLDVSNTSSGNYRKSMTTAPSIDIVVTSFDDDDDQETNGAKIGCERPKTPCLDFERPKTPVYKILSDEEMAKSDMYHGFDKNQHEGQFDSLDQNINNEIEKCFNSTITTITEELPRHTPIDFHIGEPVTPTPMSNFQSEVDMDSIILASNLEEALMKYDRKIQSSMSDHESNPSRYGTPFRQTPFELMSDNEILSMYEGPPKSGDFTLTPDHCDESSTTEAYQKENNSSENSLETIDSAYMSTDEFNGSTDTTSSTPKSDGSCKMKLYSIEETVDDFSHMGPAEQEIWETINEANEKENLEKIHQDDSGSDNKADVNSSCNKQLTASSVQIYNAEFKDVNRGCQSLTYEERCLTPNSSPAEKTPVKKNLSRMVSEKKEYWDGKILSMQSEENKLNRSPKRDSCDEKRNNFHKTEVYSRNSNIDDVSERELETPSPNQKLVEKWKNYWNEKLEKCSTPDLDIIYMQKEVTKTRRFLASPDVDEIDEIFYNDKLDCINDNYKEKTMKKENNTVTATDSKNYNIEKNSTVAKGLSKRIDKFLDTVSILSPCQEIENEIISYTEDQNQVKTSHMTKTQSIELSTKACKSQSSIENYKETEKHRNSPISRPFTPINPPEEIRGQANENELTQKIHIKSKIESFNRAASARSFFSSSRSYTADMPRMSSFKNLQKYFSLDSVEKCVEIGEISEEQITNDVPITKTDRKIISRTVSSDSLPTLAEKKAVIELHLQNIQNRLKNQSTLQSEQCQSPKIQENSSINFADVVKSDNNDVDVQMEIRQVTKPIGAILAKFENHSKSYENKERLLKDAVNSEGTNRKVKLGASLTAGNNMRKVVNLYHQQNESQCETEKKNNSKSDEFIQSPNHKEGFRNAKSFFENLNKSQPKFTKKLLNECEKLLTQDKTTIDELNLQNETVQIVPPPRTRRSIKERKKIKIKAFSTQTTETDIEFEKYIEEKTDNRLISEKYLVKDLFKDVAGDSCKIGYNSFRGIPHKKAVLAAFNSMEHIDQQLSSYEYSSLDHSESVEKRITQKYYNEFPYLPISDPRKSKSRSNFAASGLIMRGDYIKMKKSRRNSAPSSLSCDPDLYAS